MSILISSHFFKAPHSGSLEVDRDLESTALHSPLLAATPPCSGDTYNLRSRTAGQLCIGEVQITLGVNLGMCVL